MAFVFQSEVRLYRSDISTQLNGITPFGDIHPILRVTQCRQRCTGSSPPCWILLYPDRAYADRVLIDLWGRVVCRADVCRLFQPDRTRECHLPVEWAGTLVLECVQRAEVSSRPVTGVSTCGNG